jgi:hypothetical protein
MSIFLPAANAGIEMLEIVLRAQAAKVIIWKTITQKKNYQCIQK